MRKFLVTLALATTLSTAAYAQTNSPQPQLSLIDLMLKVNLTVKAAELDSVTLLNAVEAADAKAIRAMHKTAFGWTVVK